MIQPFIEPGIPPALFWLFTGLGIIIQGISKSGFAGGAGVLSIPLMMLVMPVDKVAATLLPLLILCDFNALYHHRRNKIWKYVLEIWAPSIVGILIGAALWWKIGQEGIGAYSVYLKRFVGVIALVFAIYIIAKDRAMSWVDHLRPNPVAAGAVGVVAGFISTLTHAAGPLVTLYMYTHGLGKTLFVGTVAWTFTLINLTKLPFYFGVGLIDRDVLIFDLFLVPLIPVGSFLGKWMHDRVSEQLFNRVICVLVLIAGVQLLFGVNLILWR